MPTPTFAAISLLDLTAVTGGCCKKKEPPPPPPPQPGPPPPQAAPSAGTEIVTNVQMTGFGSSLTGAQ
jgi:hypothetical protein